MKNGSTAAKLLQSGIIFSAISFLTGLGNLAFQSVMGNHLTEAGQYGNTNSALNTFMPLLGLIPSIAVFAVTHYIAHYNSIGDTAGLHGLLAGCRKFLFRLTLFGSLLAIALAKPLGTLFQFSTSLMIVTLVFTLLGLWTSLATALCQGLAWFKRLALIAFLAMVLKVALGYGITLKWPRPEMFVVAAIFSLTAYLILLFWRRDLATPAQTPVTSPWNREFIDFLVVSAALVVGNYCFSLSDLLVMQCNFPRTAGSDAYTAAERLGFALPSTVGPLLTVLFTNRSAARTTDAFRAQMKLIALYAAGLVFGAVCLCLLRHLCLKILHKDSPEAAEMIRPLAVTMVFVGLLQAMGTWALASRWRKIALLYGALGLAYTILNLMVGTTSAALLHAMPLAAGTAFVILFAVWFIALRRHQPVASSPSP
jgi:hypothetical protein